MSWTKRYMELLRDKYTPEQAAEEVHRQRLLVESQPKETNSTKFEIEINSNPKNKKNVIRFDRKSNKN